jgi:TRAP-type C4-dicarboxylate transport system substrate-binding protein
MVRTSGPNLKGGVTMKAARTWMRGITTAGALLVSVALAPAAHADDKPIVMKISLVTLDDALHLYARNYAAAIERDSNGRIKPEIFPESQLGSTQRQAEAVQFGAIQCQVVAPEFLVGIDERFEVLAAPGLVTSWRAGQRLAADPAVQSLMLGLGADKGLHGAGLFMASPSSIIATRAIRRLADFKGKKIRVFASHFESVAMQRLGVIPKPMTLAEVLPALQDNSIDGAVANVSNDNTLHYVSAAKYVTEIGQPVIYGIVEISKKWYDALPAELQKIIDKDAASEALSINHQTIEIDDQARNTWIDSGGELISLPSDEQSALPKIISSAGDEVASTKPSLLAAYKIVSEAAQRAQQ